MMTITQYSSIPTFHYSKLTRKPNTPVLQYSSTPSSIMKSFIACLVLSIVSVGAGNVFCAEQPVTVISPKRFETLHAFPVPVVVEFGPGVKPETFKASLNDADVTQIFEKTDNGMRAFVGLEHGLRVRTGEDLLRTPNMLRIRVQGSEPDQDIDFETYFFVDVDQLVTIGPGGGAIESLDGRLVVDIPERALSSRTIVAVAEVRSSGSIGSAYQLSPAGLRLDQPVRVTMKYTPEELWTDVVEDDLHPQRLGSPGAIPLMPPEHLEQVCRLEIFK